MILAAGRVSALVININPASGGGLDPSSGTFNAAASAAFRAAADDLASRFTDPISVNVTADLTGSGFSSSRIIGQTSAVFLADSYTDFRESLVADAAADPGKGTLAVESTLPASPLFRLPPAITSKGVTSSFVLGDDVAATKANFKTLGFTGLDQQFGANDGSISFNSAFSFSFDGPQAGKVDFRATAEHELIHLLGYDSAVDIVDQIAGTATTSQSYTIDPEALDLFRFSAGELPTLATNAVTTRDLVPGNDDFLSDTSDAYEMSTGFFLGDGNQASHWKADELTGFTIGIMDPTLATDQATAVSGADVRSLALIGYDSVPEPGIGVLTSVGGVALLRRRRRMHPEGINKSA